MRNLTIVVAWHGGFPKVSTSCIDPRGSTLSPENSRRKALTGPSFSLPMPILSKADAKMMSAELPLSTRSLWIVSLATMAFITSGLSWGMLAAFHVNVQKGYDSIQSRKFGYIL